MSNQLEFNLEGLENREMMAADVTQNGGLLKVVGDSAGDIVAIQGTGGTGNVEVFVNGNLAGTYNGVQRIKTNLRGGNDRLNVSSLDISQGMNVRMGTGADRFDLDTTFSNYGGSIGVNDNVDIGGNVRVNMGGNAGDWLDWDVSNGDGIHIQGGLSVRGASDIDFNGDGGTSAVQNDDIGVGGNLRVALRSHGNVGGNAAEIFLDDVNVNGRTRIAGSIASDTMVVNDSRFVGNTVIALGGGNDTLDMSGVGEESYFGQHVLFNGGFGTDTLVENAANVFNGGHTVFSFENII